MNFLKKSLNPMYQQISEYLENKIKDGIYKVGTQIPTEVELMEQFGVSRVTVRLAIKDLLKKEMVEKRQGKGTFVKKSTFYHRLEGFKGLYETFLEAGIKPETEMLDFKKIEATQEIQIAFRIKKGQQILRMNRLYYIDEIPVALTQISLPPKLIDLITIEEAKNYPILDIVSNKFGSSIGKAHLEIFSEIASPFVQKALRLPRGAAVLGSERIIYSTNNEPIEHALHWFRSDSYRFSLDLQGNPKFKLSEVNQFRLKKPNGKMSRE